MKKVFLIVIVAIALVVSAGILVMKNKTAENPQPIQTPNSTLTPSPSPAPTQNETAGACPSTAKDIDGNIYSTVKIGEQCWLKENLKVTKNPQGKAIDRFCYDNDPRICQTDGGLYDWNTAMNGSDSCNGTGASQPQCSKPVQGICPSGWHIPSHYEWTLLEKNVGSNPETFPYDSTTKGLLGMNEGKNLESGGSSGFEAIIAGFHGDDGSFYLRGKTANFWSSTESWYSAQVNIVGKTQKTYTENEYRAWDRHLDLSYLGKISRGLGDEAFGFSVRCLKD